LKAELTVIKLRLTDLYEPVKRDLENLRRDFEKRRKEYGD
jgi:hypothetical protein